MGQLLALRGWVARGGGMTEAKREGPRLVFIGIKYCMGQLTQMLQGPVLLALGGWGARGGGMTEAKREGPQ